MKSLELAGRTVRTELPAFIMGIVNATPDSFWEQSRGGADEALHLVDEGADILDIGGESTRPGSAYVDEAEEIRRVVPVIEAVRRHSAVPISVDTRKAAVMRAALDAGADILNDVSALEDDAGMAALCARARIPVILMHKRGVPATMQGDTAYDDIFRAVDSYLRARVDYARAAGIAPEKIILDPGIGFGKDAAGNFALIRRCGELCGGEYPVLMALSRKTCIGQATGQGTAGRLAGTLAADVLAVAHGASIIRVHDVRAARDTMAVYNAVERGTIVA